MRNFKARRSKSHRNKRCKRRSIAIYTEYPLHLLAERLTGYIGPIGDTDLNGRSSLRP